MASGNIGATPHNFTLNTTTGTVTGAMPMQVDASQFLSNLADNFGVTESIDLNDFTAGAMGRATATGDIGAAGQDV